ncbi:MAG TPA: hypothetical protein DD435_01590 [Cyanobacteria bacterium UBA8530]|nr:hypothetical protein [Cyanobacteria bacterium UBA8530]
MKLQSALVTGLLFFSLPALAAPKLTARAFILLDGQGKVLFQRNPDAKLPPASTTKILTALVVLEQCDPNEVVTVSANAAGTPPSSIGLSVGEQFGVEELLFALLLCSANDAAVALAEHVAGSEGEFAKLMNQKAIELGATDSHFVNPHGLPDQNHWATAKDLSVLMRAAMENPDFVRIAQTQSKKLEGGLSHRPRFLTAHNRLLPLNVIGKTGFTNRARFCFVGSDKKMTMVLLGSEHLWKEAKSLLSFSRLF